MTSEQIEFSFVKKNKQEKKIAFFKIKKNNKPLLILKANSEELLEHENFFKTIKSNN